MEVGGSVDGWWNAIVDVCKVMDGAWGGWIINYLNFIVAELHRTSVGALLDSDCRVLIRAKNKADVWDCVSRRNER